MTDKELIRRALLGDQQAQQECTKRGIMLPCPFCGSENIVISVISNWGLWRGWCQECLGKSDERSSQADAIRKWNTRPAPPVGRCGDCKYYTAMSHCQVHSLGPDQYDPDDFCSYFEPREE